MQSTITERITELIKSLGENTNSFSNKIGVSQSTIATALKRNKGVNSELLEKIFNAFPIINNDWLLTGEGDMLKSDLKYNEVREVDPNYIDVPLVTVKAQAGYLTNFGNEAFIKDLPIVKVHADRTFHGEYRCFEVSGDSMNDGTLKSICDGDTIFCREVRRDLWHYKLHYKQWFFVINHIEGLLVKQIVNHDIGNGTITCHSLNPVYGPDFVLKLDDIRELYNVIKITDRSMNL